MRIKITRNAKEDIRNIKEYIAHDNKKAATYFVAQLKRVFLNLVCYPKLGKYRYEFKENDIYSFVFKRYIIVYGLSDGELKILRVLSEYQSDINKF
ncbi:type II toxin-antitoxin system RelE/ParE family toxin [bacterium]|nr:type II toxin-antitoxin system RelE/ParE family toxin [bacterium]